jgi:hypothetical protein
VRRLGILLVGGALAAASCSAERAPSAGPPTPTPSRVPATPLSTPIPPVLYFNLTEEDALRYLEALDDRIEEALHEGDLGALHDLYTDDGPAGKRMAERIVRNYRRRVVDRLRYEVVSTRVLRIGPQVAVFRQVRMVHPCAFTYDDQHDVTPDSRIMRQVVVRTMADERLNWKIEREMVRSQEPTGDRVSPCPP